MPAAAAVEEQDHGRDIEGTDEETLPPCKQSRVARFFDWVDMILSKTTKLVLYILEGIGVYWVFHFMWLYDNALNMVATATTPDKISQAKEMVGMIKTSVDSTYAVVLGLCAALPGLIASLRTIRKVKEIKQTTTKSESKNEAPDQPA